MSLLAFLGDFAITELIERIFALGGGGNEWDGSRQPNLFESLCDGLDSKDSELRAKAILMLGQLGDTRAVPALTPILGELRPVAGLVFKPTGEAADTAGPDSEHELSFGELSAIALGKLGQEKLTAAFVRAVNGDSAADELAPHMQPAVIEALLRAIDSDRVPESINAARALAELGAQDAIPALRSRTGFFGPLSSEVKAGCEAAATKMQTLGGLPRAANAREIDQENLPRSAAASEPSRETLPRTT